MQVKTTPIIAADFAQWLYIGCFFQRKRIENKQVSPKQKYEARAVGK
tara:strand:+ start:223 stop:363 length:141 start_codon:yes stop_codon:yes gene_type:complete